MPVEAHRILAAALMCLAVTNLLEFSSAFPDQNTPCDFSQLEKCILPALSLLRSSDGEQIMMSMQMSVPSQGLDISQNQTVLVCKTMQQMVECASDYVDRCTDPRAVDVFEFFHGTMKLLAVCDHPDLYPGAMKFMNCNMLRYAASPAEFQACTNMATNSIPWLKTPTEAVLQQAMLSETFLKDICCAIQEQDAHGCLVPQSGQCSAEATGLTRYVFDAIEQVYGCGPKLASFGCAAPTKMAWDGFNQKDSSNNVKLRQYLTTFN